MWLTKLYCLFTRNFPNAEHFNWLSTECWTGNRACGHCQDIPKTNDKKKRPAAKSKDVPSKIDVTLPEKSNTAVIPEAPSNPPEQPEQHNTNYSPTADDETSLLTAACALLSSAEDLSDLESELSLFNIPTALPLNWTDDDEDEWLFVEVFKGVPPAYRISPTDKITSVANQYRHCGKIRLVWYNERVEENISPSQLQVLLVHRYVPFNFTTYFLQLKLATLT